MNITEDRLPVRKPEARRGIPGTTLSKKSVKEKIRSGQFRHTVENRVNGEPVTGKLPNTDYISRYVIDLKILAEAKEVRFYADADGNHHIPRKYLSEVIYGDTLKSLAVDLYSEGNISLNRIIEKFEELLAKDYQQNEKTQHKYAASEELTLLNRLTKYQNNHLLFLHDANVKIP